MNPQAPTLPTEQKTHSRWPFVIVVCALLLLGAYLLGPILAYRPFPGSQIAQAKTDIASLEAALTDFKAMYGDYPPSRITLSVNADAQTPAEWDARNRAIIRYFWPGFNFDNPAYPDGFFGEGETTKTLNGAECLVFFLGGVKDKYPDGDLIGFSKNPAKPFYTGGRRTGPFLEFEPSRLIDSDDDNLNEYVDPLPKQSTPYMYYSAYRGRGYDPKDIDAGLGFYTQSPERSWKAYSYQIVSPGVDGQYGLGGLYNPDSANEQLTNDRQAERDNITNFGAGRLADLEIQRSNTRQSPEQ